MPSGWLASCRLNGSKYETAHHTIIAPLAFWMAPLQSAGKNRSDGGSRSTFNFEGVSGNLSLLCSPPRPISYCRPSISDTHLQQTTNILPLPFTRALKPYIQPKCQRHFGCASGSKQPTPGLNIWFKQSFFGNSKTDRKNRQNLELLPVFTCFRLSDAGSRNYETLIPTDPKHFERTLSTPL